jgi:hypothetical protein
MLRSTGIFIALLTACVFPIATLEPNDLWPGMRMADAVAVYTSLRSCENREFRQLPQSIGWDASLYGRLASIEVQIENGFAATIRIVLYLEPGDDGLTLFRSLAEERIRDFGNPLPDVSGSPLPEVMVWSKDDQLLRLERWPVVPAGEIHVTRTFSG